MQHPGTNNKVYKKINDNFEWSSENFKKITSIIKKYPSNRIQSAVIPLLDLAQRQNKGWLSKNSLEKVAETLSMSYIRVLEVATFYSMFNLEPIGKNYVQICRTTPCWLRGSEKLSNVAKEICETKIGKTSLDNNFTVVEVECLGACCNAPMVQINDDYYEDLDEENFRKILLNLKDNKSNKTGSQIGRKSSQPERKFNAQR
tara:strand:+ start:801 stop:1406 length:606 start_codon:yes stop_codon:yes gene_type:complete